MVYPSFPLICISGDTGLDLVLSENSLPKVVATSALLDKTVFQDILFDSNGRIWSFLQVSDKLKDNFLTKFLSKTFYNPLLDVNIIWTNIGTYQIKELKGKLKNCVDIDDDRITQFADAETIKSSLDKATTFDDLLQVLNKYLFDISEEELWNEEKAPPQ